MGLSAGTGAEAATFFGHPEIFERAVAAKSPLVVGTIVQDSAERDLLARVGMTSALLVPCVADEECLGLFLLASRTRDLTEGDWIPFARTIAVQVGQALSLGRAFSTLEHEIVERKRAESTVRQERDRAQRYLDTADVILLALDQEGRITLINRKGCEVLGWSAGELLGRDFVEAHVPARIRAETRRKLRDVHSGDDGIVEDAIVTRSGAERLIEWRTTFLRDEAGRLVSTLSSGTDVTERKHAERAQRASEARYRTLFEYAPDGIVIADRESYYIDANPSLCRMLGYSRDEFIGLHASNIVAEAEIQHIGPA